MIIELVLVSVILLFVAGAVWYARQKPSSNQTAVNTQATPSVAAAPQVSQITSASDVDTSIKELDSESTAQLDSDLNAIDADLNSL